MKVGIVMDRLTTGGTERQMEMLLSELSGSVDFAVCAFGSEGSMASRFEAYASLTILERGAWADTRLPSRLRSWAHREHCDVLLAPHRFSGLISKASRLLGLSTPVICAIRGLEHAAEKNSLLYDSLDLHWMRSAAAVIINAEVMRKHLPKWEWLQAKLEYIPNGLHAAGVPSPESRLAARRNLRFAGHDLVIASVGRLVDGKAPMLAATAVQSLRAQGISAKLLWIGDGPLRSILEQSLPEEDDWLRCTGFVDDVPSWLAAADIYLHPSHWENTSNAILEAMGCGLPVLARRVGGNPEVIQHGETGFLFQSDEEMTELLRELATNEAVRRHSGENALAAVRARYSAATMAQRHLELFQRFAQVR